MPAPTIRRCGLGGDFPEGVPGPCCLGAQGRADQSPGVLNHGRLAAGFLCHLRAGRFPRAGGRAQPVLPLECLNGTQAEPFDESSRDCVTALPIADGLPAPGELLDLFLPGVSTGRASPDPLLLGEEGGGARRARQPCPPPQVKAARGGRGRPGGFLHRIDQIHRPAGRPAHEPQGLQRLAGRQGPPRPHLDHGTAFQLQAVVLPPSLHHARPRPGTGETRKALPRCEPGAPGRLPGLHAAEDRLQRPS